MSPFTSALILLCGFPVVAARTNACANDRDCPKYHYCSSKKRCTAYGKDYCYSHTCGEGDGDCDYGDWMGCASGLQCGKDNCARYHQLGTETGFSAGSDCCEPASNRDGGHSDGGKKKRSYYYYYYYYYKHRDGGRHKVKDCTADSQCPKYYYCP